MRTRQVSMQRWSVHLAEGSWLPSEAFWNCTRKNSRKSCQPLYLDSAKESGEGVKRCFLAAVSEQRPCEARGVAKDSN